MYGEKHLLFCWFAFGGVADCLTETGTSDLMLIFHGDRREPKTLKPVA
jgi:hypothetical protein